MREGLKLLRPGRTGIEGRRAPVPDRPLAGLVLAVSLTLSLSAAAEEHDPRLVRALSDFERAPSDVVLDAFEPGLLDSLLALIDDQSLPRLVRLRAFHALGRYPDQAPAFERLRNMALDVDGDPRMRLAAVGTLGHRLTGHPETVEILGLVLRDPDPGVRARAVRLLSHVGGERAQEILARHRVIEMHVVVRKALRAALESRSGGPLPPEGRLRPVRPQIRLQGPVGPTEVAGEEEALR